MPLQKVALVIGASQGIGRSTAIALAQQGYTLVINARRIEPLQTLLQEIKNITPVDHMLFIGDITDHSIREQLFTQIGQIYGRLDILINNVPGGAPDHFEEFDYEVTLQAFAQKALTYVDCMQKSSQYMKKNQFGRIINLVGNLWKEPGQNMFTNSMINASIINASKNISQTLASSNITVNCINPGFIKTDRYYKYIDSLTAHHQMTTKQAEAQVADGIPMQRVGTSEEAASLINYLCSPDAGYITGQQISIDGGTLKSI